MVKNVKSFKIKTTIKIQSVMPTGVRGKLYSMKLSKTYQNSLLLSNILLTKSFISLGSGHQLRGGEGATTLEGEGGGASEVLPLQKGGTGKVLAIPKVGHKRFWGSFNTGA